MLVKDYSDIKQNRDEKELQLIEEVEKSIKKVKNGTVSLTVKDGEIVCIEKCEFYRW